MSSVTKPIAASTSPVASSRSTAGSTRQVSSQYGAVSELYAQTGVRGEDQARDFDDFGRGGGDQNPSHEQPRTLKLHGTSRTFAMLYEETQEGFVEDDGGSYYDGDTAANAGGQPAFRAYMAQATATYDISNRAIAGEFKSRGGSLNVAM